jgi:hypothetical protein
VDEEPESSTLPDIMAIYQEDVAGYYTALRRLAASDGLIWDEAVGGWLVLSYRLCGELAQSGVLGCQAGDLPSGPRPDVGELVQSIFRAQFRCQDPATFRARHAHWMSLLNRVADDVLAGIASALLEPYERQVDHPDLYNPVLDGFASTVVCRALGIDEQHRIRLQPLIMSYVRLLDGKLTSARDVDDALLAVARLYNQLSLITPPGAEPAGYSRHEWLSDLELALVAGHTSVAYLLGTIFLNVEPPRERGRAYLSRLVAESIRYDSPVQFSGHVLRSTIRVQDKTLRRGDRIFLHLGTANHDPVQFSSPDCFDASRTPRRSLSFGAVPASQCPGRALASRSAVAFLQTLVERDEWLVPDREGVEYDNGIGGRGFRRIPGRVVRLARA